VCIFIGKLACADVVWDELSTLIRDRVSAMDAFERKHAGSTIATELTDLIVASRKAQQERQAQRNRLDELYALAERISQRDRAKYEAEQKKRDEEDAYAAAHAHEI